MRKTHVSISAAILTVVLLGSGEYAMVIGHLLADFDGVVVARSDSIHYPPWTRNLANRYVIQEANGRKYVYYADPSEGDLGGFAIGTRITKERWRMDYEADGRTRQDFPLPLYLLWMILDFGIFVAVIILGIMIRMRDRRTRDLEAAVERGRELLAEMKGPDA